MNSGKWPNRIWPSNATFIPITQCEQGFPKKEVSRLCELSLTEPEGYPEVISKFIYFCDIKEQRLPASYMNRRTCDGGGEEDNLGRGGGWTEGEGGALHFLLMALICRRRRTWRSSAGESSASKEPATMSWKTICNVTSKMALSQNVRYVFR